MRSDELLLLETCLLVADGSPANPLVKSIYQADNGLRAGALNAQGWARMNVSLMGVILALASLVGGVGAEPLLEKVDVFEGGQGGYALYRIPGLVVTKKGTVLAYCEARRTGKSDWDAIDILMRRSLDGGKTWSAPSTVANVPGPKHKNPALKDYKGAKPEDITYNNPVAIAGADGTVHLLFCLEYMECFYQRSTDDGVTWSKPVEITGAFEAFRKSWDWKVLATGPGHGIELRSGRLLVPVWLSTGAGGGNAHRPSVTATIYSDDRGATWQAGSIAVPNTAEWVNPNETVAVELTDGSVLLNVRSESKNHRRLVTVSKDGASNWSTPRFDEALLEPICMAGIVRVPRGEDRLRDCIVFSNPHNLARKDGKELPGRGRDRKNLTMHLSCDDAKSWSVQKPLEPGTSAYSDLAALPDGTVLCFYERSIGAGDGRPATNLLTLARFNLEWLSSGGRRRQALR